MNFVKWAFDLADADIYPIRLWEWGSQARLRNYWKGVFLKHAYFVGTIELGIPPDHELLAIPLCNSVVRVKFCSTSSTIFFSFVTPDWGLKVWVSGQWSFGRLATIEIIYLLFLCWRPRKWLIDLRYLRIIPRFNFYWSVFIVNHFAKQLFL